MSRLIFSENSKQTTMSSVANLLGAFTGKMIVTNAQVANNSRIVFHLNAREKDVALKTS